MVLVGLLGPANTLPVGESNYAYSSFHGESDPDFAPSTPNLPGSWLEAVLHDEVPTAGTVEITDVFLVFPQWWNG